MSDFKTRVILEKASLDINLLKLKAFIKSHTYTSLADDTKDLLQHQADYMKAYSDVLGQRIRQWE